MPPRKRLRHYIEILNGASVVVKEIGPYNEQTTAETAERGVNRNLNHEQYWTRIVSRRT